MRPDEVEKTVDNEICYQILISEPFERFEQFNVGITCGSNEEY